MHTERLGFRKLLLMASNSLVRLHQIGSRYQ
jgi:hypothetical protein